MRLSSVLAATTLAATTLAAMLAAVLGGSPVAAASKYGPFKSVHGWAIEHPTGTARAQSCRMTRTAQDAQGEIVSVVIVSLDGPILTLALADRDWDFATDQRLTVPLLLDGRPTGSNTIWTGDGQVLRATLPDTILPDLMAARVVTLRAADGEASFAIPDFAAGYEALRQCDAAMPSPPAIAAEPGLPPRARMAAYAVGLAVERVLRDCDVAATDLQRKAIEAKMAALRPEMAPYEPAIRAQLTKAHGFACPTADKEPGFREAMRRFIELSPEDLAAVIDKQAQAEPAGSPGLVTKP